MGLGLEEKPSRLPSGFSKATPEACPATGVSTDSALEIVKIFHCVWSFPKYFSSECLMILIGGMLNYS